MTQIVADVKSLPNRRLEEQWSSFTCGQPSRRGLRYEDYPRPNAYGFVVRRYLLHRGLLGCAPLLGQLDPWLELWDEFVERPKVSEIEVGDCACPSPIKLNLLAALVASPILDLALGLSVGKRCRNKGGSRVVRPHASTFFVVHEQHVAGYARLLEMCSIASRTGTH